LYRRQGFDFLTEQLLAQVPAKQRKTNSHVDKTAHINENHSQYDLTLRERPTMPAKTSLPNTTAPCPAVARSDPLESSALLGSRAEILIRHCGQTYRLRRTRQDKLILTK